MVAEDNVTPVDARGGTGIQVGDHNTQIVYNYNLTWTDGMAPSPLVSASGEIDSPYRGLGAYEEQDAPFFFGREQSADQILSRMSRQVSAGGLLVVSGVSGAGKSSLLRAGVLPRIRAAGLTGAPETKTWPGLVFTPTRRPLDELAARVAEVAGADVAAIRRSLATDPQDFALPVRQAALAAQRKIGEGTARAGLILVIDQFEQVFTLCSDESGRQAFVQALHAAASGVRPAALVVLTVRADFEAQAASYQQLFDAIQDRYLLPTMTEQQLRLAIGEPARVAGSAVQPELVEVLLGHATGPGVLPLLSHALDQTWRNRAAETMTLADYERTGGIEGAIQASAQRAYDHLSSRQQAAARPVFLRLTATTSDGVDVSTRATQAELTEGKSEADVQDVEAVLAAFAAERLLTLAVDSVEISHEALLTTWPLLRDTWLADTHEDRIVQTRLRNTAIEWDRNDRDSSYLYSGTLLLAADQTASRIDADPVRYPALTGAEHDFLQASTRARRQRVRARQGLIAILMVLVVGLGAATVSALLATGQANRAKDDAIAGQLLSESASIGDTNPALARLLAVAAWRINPSSQAHDAMLAAATLPGTKVIVDYGGGDVTSVAFSPDGKTLASADLSGFVRTYDVKTGQTVGRLITDKSTVNSVAFSPDGKTLATCDSDSSASIWDVVTGNRLAGPLSDSRFVPRDQEALSVAFSPNGKLLASAAGDVVSLWNTATGHLIHDLHSAGTGAVESVAFSPDGKLLASANVGGAAWLWNLATGRREFKLGQDSGTVAVAVAFSPDGKTIASGYRNGTVGLWDVMTGRPIHRPINDNAGLVTSVAFSPDGQTLAVGDSDGSVRLWNATTSQPIGSPLTGSASGVNSVAFSPDGHLLATGNGDGTIRLWDVAASLSIGPAGTVDSVAISPDSQKLAIGYGSGEARLWSLHTRNPVGRPMEQRPLFPPLSARGPGSITSLAFSPDDKSLATADTYGDVWLWNTSTDKIKSRVIALLGAANSLAFSPDGKLLAAGNDTGQGVLWDVATGHGVGTVGDQTDPTAPATILSAAFSPDGRLVAIARDTSVQVWNISSSKIIRNLTVSSIADVTSVAFSPSGKLLAAAAGDGTVRLWDAATGQPISSPLNGHAGAVSSVAFSRNSEILAVGNGDGTVELWDVATIQPVARFPIGPTETINSVAFSPNGNVLIAASSQSVMAWNVSYLKTDVVRFLCAAAERQLTRSEWARYVSANLAYRRVC